MISEKEVLKIESGYSPEKNNLVLTTSETRLSSREKELEQRYNEGIKKAKEILANLGNTPIGEYIKTRPGNVPEVVEAYNALQEAKFIINQGNEPKKEKIEPNEAEKEKISDFEFSDFAKKNINEIEGHIANIEEQIQVTAPEEINLLEGQLKALSEEKCNEYFVAFLRYLNGETISGWENILNESCDKSAGDKKAKLDKIRDYVLKVKPELSDLVALKPDEKIGEWLTKITKILVTKK